MTLRPSLYFGLPSKLKLILAFLRLGQNRRFYGMQILIATPCICE